MIFSSVMSKMLRRWTIVGAVGSTVLAAACGASDDAPPPPEAHALAEKDPVTGTVDFYAPNDTKQVLAPGANAEQAAMDWLEANKGELGIPNPKDSFTPIGTTTDEEDKTTSVKLEQKAGGLPVWGIESVVHFDEDGSVALFDGPFIPNLDAIAKQVPTIDEATALRTAEAAIREDLPPVTIVMTPLAQQLVVHVDDEYGAPALARRVRLSAESDTFTFAAEAFVDALNGNVLDAWVDAESDEVTAPGLDGDDHRVHVNGPYDADQHWEMFRGENEVPNTGWMIPGNWIGPKNGKWRDIKASTKEGPWDRHAVSAMLNARRSERFYVDNFKWTGPNGKGNQLFLGLHFANDGEWNAFAHWSDNGKNDTINFTDRHEGMESAVVALDVVGHEFTHLVTAYNSRLVYRRQPGAINEAMSDIFGAFTERFIFGRSDSAFLMAEATGKHIRDMRHPHSTGEGKFGLRSDNMNELKTLDKGERPKTKRNDNGYVHYNSSIVNNAWSLQVEGGKHDTTGVTVSRKTGWDKSIRLWWKTQRQVLTRRSTIKRLARAQSYLAQRSKGRYDVRAVACSWFAVSALSTDWVENKLRIRCDGAPPPAEESTESCAGKADGVYCSTTNPEIGYICRGGVISTVKCLEGFRCISGQEGQVGVLCRP